MNFTWSSSLSLSLSGCVPLIFSSWHAAPSFLCVISPSQICLLCLSLLCQLRESRSSVAAPIWACKYPLRLIARFEHCATASLSLSLNKVRIRGEGLGMRASVRPPQNKVRCICMQLNSEEYIFNRVRMSCSVMYYCAMPVCLCVRACSPACVRLCITKSTPQDCTCSHCDWWNASKPEKRIGAIQHRGD